MGSTSNFSAQDFLNSPSFQGLSKSDQFNFLSSISPEFKAMKAEDQQGFIQHVTGAQHGQPEATPKQTEYEKEVASNEGFGKKSLGTLGRQAESVLGMAFAPVSSGYDAYEQARKEGKGVGSSLGRGIYASEMANPFNPINEVEPYAAVESGQEYQRERGQGRSKIYSALAPAGAAVLNAVGPGLNLPRMEHEADVGSKAGVLAEGAVPAAEAGLAYVAGQPAVREAGAEMVAPLRMRQEANNITSGAGDIETALATPAGKGGARAAQMKEDLRIATPDLAEIEKEMPSKVSAILKRGQGAESFRDTADRVQARMDDMWEKGHQPGIDRHAQAELDGKNGNGNIDTAVRAGQAAITDEARQNNPTEANAAQAWLDNQNRPTTLRGADKLIREINDDLRSKSKGEQINPYGNVGVRVRNAFVKALRQQVDSTLENSGEQGIRQVNRRWGALNNIHDRLLERAVQLGLQESKRGIVPDWLHAYMFLHPEATLPAVGVGVAFNRIAPDASTRLTRGMRALGNTGLTAPYEAVPPANWRAGVETNPARMLPPAPIELRPSFEPIAPPEDKFQGPLPQDYNSTRAQRKGLLLPRGAIQLGSSLEPLGQTQYTPVESGNAASVVQRNPNTGRMQRMYTAAVNPPPVEGRTSESTMYREGPPLRAVEKAVAKSTPKLTPDQVRENVRIQNDPMATAVEKQTAMQELHEDEARYPKKSAQRNIAQEGAKQKGVKGGSQEESRPAYTLTTDTNGTRWATAPDGVRVSLHGNMSKSEITAKLESQRNMQASLRQRLSGGK